MTEKRVSHRITRNLMIPRSQSQVIADWLLLVGLAIAAFGMATSVPVVYVGFGISVLGCWASFPQVVKFAVGWPWAMAFSGWVALVGIISPYDISRIPPGFVYCWPAMAVWALAASDRRRLSFAWWALAGGALGAALLALAQAAVGYNRELRPFRIDAEGVRWEKASGFYSHWIRFGDAMACATLWLVVWLQTGLSSPQRALFGSCLVGMIGVIATFISSARGAFLALLGGAWLLAAGLVSRRRLGLVTIGLIGLSAVTVMLAPPLYQERLRNALSGQDGRIYIWDTAWHTFLQRPWLGVGDGAYNQAATATVTAGLSPAGPEGPEMGNAHNSFLSLLVLYGVPGLLLWSGWLLSVVRHLWKRRANHPAVWPITLATLGVFLVGGLTEDLAAYASSRFQLFFGLALALGLAAQATDAERAESDRS